MRAAQEEVRGLYAEIGRLAAGIRDQTSRVQVDAGSEDVRCVITTGSASVSTPRSRVNEPPSLPLRLAPDQRRPASPINDVTLHQTTRGNLFALMFAGP